MSISKMTSTLISKMISTAVAIYNIQATNKKNKKSISLWVIDSTINAQCSDNKSSD